MLSKNFLELKICKMSFSSCSAHVPVSRFIYLNQLYPLHQILILNLIEVKYFEQKTYIIFCLKKGDDNNQS